MSMLDQHQIRNEQQSPNIQIQEQLQSIMKISYSLLLILSLILVASVKAATNGTQSYFISMAGLGKTLEVQEALQKIAGQLRIKTTTYNRSSTTYILSNITVGIAYNDAKQASKKARADVVQISGGKVEFTYRFNYTKIENRNNITGYGYGSVFSDALTYYKEFGLGQSFYMWKLPSSGSAYDKLTITTNKLKLKRMDPFNQTDLQSIEDMLDNATTAIDPVNIKSQILETFNNIFPLALNESLNHETIGQNVTYTYYSNTHGEMTMKVIHKMYGFGIDDIGWKVIFVTELDNWDQPLCQTNVTDSPYDYALKGTPQNVHLHCIYESVVSYLQANGWLDVVLNDSWESDSFQFYAGDLFDLIGNLNVAFSPRALLSGKCLAQKQGLRFASNRNFQQNSYYLDVIYNCNLQGTKLDGTTAQILKFKSTTRLYIKTEPSSKAMGFKIMFGDILNLSFEPVGQYYVNNIKLAMFKAVSVLNNIKNTYTFGTGFPSLPRALPKAQVEENLVLYYDSSSFALEGIQQS